MKNTTQAEDKILQEIDRQVEKLKDTIEEQYKNATMDEMELIVLKHAQEIGRSALESYYKKKNAELKDIKEIEVEEKKI